MRFSGLVSALGVTVISSAFVVSTAWAAHDPCKVLTAEKFSQIMGSPATINKTASNEMNCYYSGPGHSGGQFHILTASAAGPQADAMLQGRGSTPPPGSGLVGGTYRQGSVIFSVSIRSADQDKLQALVAEIKRNLK